MAMAAPRDRRSPGGDRHGHECNGQGERHGGGGAGNPDTTRIGPSTPEGRPTTDAAAGLAGSIAPMGGAKGYGLALMVELLAAGVTGSNWSFQTSSLTDNEGGPPDIGQLFIAINPARLGGSRWHRPAR